MRLFFFHWGRSNFFLNYFALGGEKCWGYTAKGYSNVHEFANSGKQLRSNMIIQFPLDPKLGKIPKISNGTLNQYHLKTCQQFLCSQLQKKICKVSAPEFYHQIT